MLCSAPSRQKSTFFFFFFACMIGLPMSSDLMGNLCVFTPIMVTVTAYCISSVVRKKKNGLSTSYAGSVKKILSSQLLSPSIICHWRTSWQASSWNSFFSRQKLSFHFVARILHLHNKVFITDPFFIPKKYFCRQSRYHLQLKVKNKQNLNFSLRRVMNIIAATAKR